MGNSSHPHLNPPPSIGGGRIRKLDYFRARNDKHDWIQDWSRAGGDGKQARGCRMAWEPLGLTHFTLCQAPESFSSFNLRATRKATTAATRNRMYPFMS